MKNVCALVVAAGWGILSAVQAFAQAAPAVDGAGEGSPGITQVLIQQLPLFAMVFAIFYLLVIRPQQSKLRAHQELIKGLKRGDHVITSGGLLGRVAAVESDHVAIEVSPNVRIKVETSHIARRQGEQSSQDNGGQKSGQKAAAG